VTVANIGVGAESKLGTGGGAASFVDVRGGWREVLACGEEACSREEELWAEVGNTVVGGESKVVTGGVAFVCSDEPHSSLSVYFHISAPFADDHVIASHATYVT
jgi:hypothetical protein